MNIEDQLIEPYVIRADGTSFDVYEKKVLQSGKNAGTIEERPVGYFVSLESALNKIIKLKLASTDEVLSIKDYISEYRELSGGIKELLK